MNSEKYNRTIPLMCPTCGGTQFETDYNPDMEVPVRCFTCKLEFTKDELLLENSENLEEHVSEIKKEVVKDFEKELKQKLKKAFQGNKFIKIR